MALIKCPECEREISDKVNSCPNCGYPMEVDNNEAQKVELSSVNIKVDKNKKSKILRGILSIISVFVICIAGYSFIKLQSEKSKTEEYRNNITNLKVAMISSGSEAEELLNLTSKVWTNAIYENEDIETNQYTKPKGFFVSNFNIALENLFNDGEIIQTVKNIKDGQMNVSEIIKKLNNPPEEYKSIYDTLMDMYTSYQSITDLAVNPKGNLQTFNNNKNEKIDKFMELYNKVEAQLPE